MRIHPILQLLGLAMLASGGLGAVLAVGGVMVAEPTRFHVLDAERTADLCEYREDCDHEAAQQNAQDLRKEWQESRDEHRRTFLGYAWKLAVVAAAGLHVMQLPAKLVHQRGGLN